MNIAKLPPHKDVLQDLTDYLVQKAKEHGVDLRTGQEVTEETLKGETPDQVILATGAIRVRPEVSGLESNDRLLSPEKLLTSERVSPGSYLVVGGGVGGLEIADFLAHAGVAATVIEMTAEVGRGIHSTRLYLLLERLTAAGVKVLNHTRLVSLSGGMAKVETLEGMVSLGPFDFIIFAIGYRSNRSLVEAGDLGTPMVIVGDFRCSDVIEEIENDSGKPVVTSNQATAWHLMKMLGINDVVEGYGRLLRKTPRV